MKKIDQSEMLDDMILMIKNQQRHDLQVVKHQFEHICDSLKPINILTSTIKDVKNSSAFKTSAVITGLNIVSNFFSNYLVLGPSGSILKKVGGHLLQFALSRFNNKFNINKNSQTLKQ